MKIPRALRFLMFTILAAADCNGGTLRAAGRPRVPVLATRSFVIGDEAAHTPDPLVGGLLLNGGGDWNYDAFRWFTAHAGHGHLVVLRASGTTESQDEFYNDVKGVLSVRTFVFTDRQAASDPRGTGGGEGGRWHLHRRRRPVQLRAHVARHARSMHSSTRTSPPASRSGGTSAGLAVQGPWLYGSMDGGSITSPEAMADPLGKAVTIEGDFLHTELLAHVFTDSHFDTRARLGRLFAFLAKTHTLDPQRALVGLGIDEDAAMTVETDGTARFYASVPGKHAWLVQPGEFGPLEAGKPLNLRQVRVTGIDTASTFNVRTLAVGKPAFVRSYDVVNGDDHAADALMAEGGRSATAPTACLRTATCTRSMNVMPTARALAVRAGRIVYSATTRAHRPLSARRPVGSIWPGAC